jgi:hypothetical protein
VTVLRLSWLLPLLYLTQALAAAPAESAFPGLQSHSFPSSCFGPRSVQFDPSLATASDEFIEIPDHPAGGFRTVMVGRIDRNSAARFLLRYDDGPSCDPTFSLWPEGADEPIGELVGDQVLMPGNGFLYVIRRSDRSFESREKWRVGEQGLVEVPQSQYYVGVTTTTLKAVTLHATPNAEAAVIASVPAKVQVQVVLNQTIDGHDWYLVRTPFGLVGWTEDSGYGDDRQFEALQYQGD